jgi:hypothetical protein
MFRIQTSRFEMDWGMDGWILERKVKEQQHDNQ